MTEEKMREDFLHSMDLTPESVSDSEWKRILSDDYYAGKWEGWQACAAQSAEKIARLEAEKEVMREQIVNLGRRHQQDQQQLAAAELSNKQLRVMLDRVCIQYQKVRDADSGFNGIPSKAITEAREYLAQQPSTEVLDAYVANFNPWISVKTKLPDNRQEVLARETDGCIYELRFIQERDESCTYNSWYDCDGNRYGDVAHWMPLPPSPEQKG